jgi:hypothetical protein
VRNQSAVREAMADTPLAALKVQELLREVRVDYSKTRVIEAAVAAVVDLLSGLADEEVGVCVLLLLLSLFAAVHFPSCI